LPNVELAEVVSAVKREEEQVRTRSLVRALQPLYYAIECVDERMVPPFVPVASRLSEVLESIERFVEADAGRDSGGHIRRHITSIRRKLQD